MHSDSTVDYNQKVDQTTATFERQVPNYIFEDNGGKDFDEDTADHVDDGSSIDEEIQKNEIQIQTEEVKSANVLSGFITKVPEVETHQIDEEGNTIENDLHKQHFEHTLSALNFIRNFLTVVPEEAI